jgi:hypothetical protein
MPWRPMGLWDVEAPTFYRQLADMAMKSASRAGRPYPQEDYWYSFLLEAESSPGP